MIVEAIKTRMKLTGTPSSKLAELIGSHPPHISQFLKGEGASLKTEKLQKCFDALGINIAIYTERYKLAEEAANILYDNGFKYNTVINMTQQTMVLITKLNQIELFIDADKKIYERIEESKIIDIESTYPFFKAMVIQLLDTRGKHTQSAVTTSWGKIALAAAAIPIVGILAAPIGVGLISTSLIAGLRGAACIAPLAMLARQILEKNKK